MSLFELKIIGNTTATPLELQSLIHNFLKENNLFVGEDSEIDIVNVDDVIILNYKNDDENE